MKLSIEEQKVLELTKQLDKFKMNKIFYNAGLNINKALEVENVELKMGVTISQGFF